MTTVFVYEHLTATEARRHERLASSLLAEGRAMFDAVIADFGAVSDTHILFVADESEEAFRLQCAHADWALIIAPETDGVLAERCRWAIESGACLLGPSLDAIRLTSDKWALAEHFRRRGIPHPRTQLLGTGRNDRCPMVWKPRDGAGSQQTWLLADPRDRRDCPEDSDTAFIVQEYVPGIPASVAFVIGPRQTYALAPCRQRISEDGLLRYLGGSLPLPNYLADRAHRLATSAVESVPGLFGYVGVDVILADDPSLDCVIEINPRLTTSYIGLRRLARCNIAELLLRAAAGECVAAPMWNAEPVVFSSDGCVETRE